MSLITPDFGLVFWMVVIFGAVFFILARFGFPVITGMIDKRGEKIAKSLRDAREIEAQMAGLARKQEAMLEETRRQQAALLKEATETKGTILAEAREQARTESEKILSEARMQIAAEKEAALADIREAVAMLSVQVAEQILRGELASESKQREYLDRMVAEAARQPLKQ